MLSFPALIESYLQSLEGRPSWAKAKHLVQDWIITLQTTPTRAEILARQRAVCPGGHCTPGATKANKELGFMRAACNWGLYHEVWDGGNPTVGIRKFKTPRRQRIGRQEELRLILHALDFADDSIDLRDRALIGLQLFTGCRPKEARTVLRGAITPYGLMGEWRKGRTKNGRTQTLPIPRQLMTWLAELPRTSDYLFSATGTAPIHEATYRVHFAKLRARLGFEGLWSYDLRRSLATYLRKILKQDDNMIRSILNHYDGSALKHYLHADFDEVAGVIQSYADWLFTVGEGNYANAGVGTGSLGVGVHGLAGDHGRAAGGTVGVGPTAA